jgi:hypothetical protein
MHQKRIRLGLRPRPRWGSSQRSPRPPSWTSGGLLLRGGEGRGGEEEVRRGDGKGQGGRDGKGEGGREGGIWPPPPKLAPGSAYALPHPPPRPPTLPPPWKNSCGRPWRSWQDKDVSSSLPCGWSRDGWKKWRISKYNRLTTYKNLVD